jgi:hypothetical protein
LTFEREHESAHGRVWAIDGDEARGVWAAGPSLLRRGPTGWVEAGPPGPFRDVWVAGDGAVLAVGAGGRVVASTGGGWTEEQLPGGWELTNVAGWDGGAVATAAGSEVWRREGGRWARWATDVLAGQWAGATWAGGPDAVVVAAQPMRPASAPVLWTWDGGRWSAFDTERPGFVSSIHGEGSVAWAVGYRPRLFGKGPLCLRFDGARWSPVEVPTRWALTDVRAAGGHVWVGSASPALLHWDGHRWAEHPVADVPTAVHATPSRVWVVTAGRTVYTSAV